MTATTMQPMTTSLPRKCFGAGNQTFRSLECNNTNFQAAKGNLYDARTSITIAKSANHLYMHPYVYTNVHTHKHTQTQAHTHTLTPTQSHTHTHIGREDMSSHSSVVFS